MTSTLQVVAEPEMEATYFGTPVSHIGEDGDMLALGHPGIRRAFAAFNRHARVFCGLANLADDSHATAGAWADAISERWAIFRKPDPDSEWEDPDYDWIAQWVEPGTPGARPVTVLDV
ncbi:hypothetical protein [Streptomyces chartreusis]|uniref:hypothetical protein n=1 Tax=Streptomyces chartreusis TaxID=1969 RepID=UPI0037DCBB71|nr:hypothetical protein OG938_48425 [Streptomyces chartreusis]